MARFKHYSKAKSPYFKSKRCTKPTGRMAKYVRNIVAASTAITVRYPRTDPPNIKLDRPFKRLVRIQIGPEQTNINPSNVSTTESGYYGLSGSRWQSLKVLALTAYGLEAVNGIALTFPNGPQIAQTTFTDAGDLNHRACIKAIMPPTYSRVDANSTSSFVTFPSGAIDFIDVYVEFA